MRCTALNERAGSNRMQSIGVIEVTPSRFPTLLSITNAGHIVDADKVERQHGQQHPLK